MELIFENWPFSVGHQIYIFRVGTFAVAGMIILNIYSAIQNGGGLKEIVLSMYTEPVDKNKTRNIIRRVLLVILVSSFLLTIVDISVNGQQLIDKNEIRKAI